MQGSSSVGNIRRRARQNKDLVSLAAPVLEVVLRVRADKDTPSIDLKDKIDKLLTELEEQGKIQRYPQEQIQAVKFALAAFTDETILLDENSTLSAQWEKRTLQHKIVREHEAGVVFFERLKTLLQSPQENVEVIEVYYLCLVLGFKGRYVISDEEKLKSEIEKTAAKLRELGRLPDGGLSPRWRQDDQPPLPRAPSIPAWATLGGLALAGLVAVLFLTLKILVESGAYGVQQQLLR
jgi:type VI secretion system protein ImpK